MINLDPRRPLDSLNREWLKYEFCRWTHMVVTTVVERKLRPELHFMASGFTKILRLHAESIAGKTWKCQQQNNECHEHNKMCDVVKSTLGA